MAGAIFLTAAGRVTAVNCGFLGQFAEIAGGAVRNSGRFDAVNCFFSGNHTTGGGGAISNAGSLTLTNCSVVGTRTIENSSGGGGGAVESVSPNATCDIVNSVFWDNTTAGAISETTQLALIGAFSVNHCIVQGWSGSMGGAGNSGNDPRLAHASGANGMYGDEDDDPAPLPDAPARDVGNSSALPPDQFDLDSDGNTTEPVSRDILEQPRIAGPAVDVGAVELAACPEDIDGSGAVGVDDLLVVITHWGPCAMPPPPPSNCPGDINGSGAVNVDDLLAVITHWGACP